LENRNACCITGTQNSTQVKINISSKYPTSTVIVYILHASIIARAIHCTCLKQGLILSFQFPHTWPWLACKNTATTAIVFRSLYNLQHYYWSCSDLYTYLVTSLNVNTHKYIVLIISIGKVLSRIGVSKEFKYYCGIGVISVTGSELMVEEEIHARPI